jgi:hypothetical protein
LNKDVQNNDGFASRMSGRSSRDRFGPAKNAVRTWTLDDMTILLNVFNLQNGRLDRADLRMSVTSRDEEGSGILTVSSDLPLDEHIRYLEALRQSMSPESQQG